MKIYCASDLHIGDHQANYLKIQTFLDRVQDNADQLVLAGDIFDLWQCYFSDIVTQEPMKSTYDLLIESAKKVPTVYVKGNHDAEIDKYIKDLKIVNSHIQDNILFIHGQQFDYLQWLGFPFYDLISDYFPWIYQRYFKTPYQVINYQDIYTEQIRVIDTAVQKYTERKGLSYTIFGHTHYSEIGQKIVNCGDFCNDKCSYVIIENGIPSLHYL